MNFRRFLLAGALLVAAPVSALAQSGDDIIRPPVLRASVSVASDVVRIGDVIENAGAAAGVPIYRSPDLGTTGTLPAAQVLNVLRAHQVIGVAAGDVREVTVTRLARTITPKDIRGEVARAIEHRGGLGDAANLSLTFDRDLQDIRLDAANAGELQPASAHVETRTGRFDVSFEIANGTAAPTQLRFTGSVIETVEATVLTRNIDRTELLKSSDLMVERRPKAEVGSDPAPRDQVIGMQMRRPMRAGQPLRMADLVKPDLVQRDQPVTVVYQSAGLYLTTRGKALDSGAEGDVVNVLNPQSKRTVTGIVTGRGQVTIQIATPTPVLVSDTSAIASSDTETTGSIAADTTGK
ncbi:MAG: flagellar basal body P-ring formation protein FlgA [Bradyrhizobium sp.]|uniref:flagellar basal body P-ring formation chaperone FlgA n=1 Tax=Bradyrhizobium sp. TaxID=376 RepID=UPI001DA8329F|nr:flagellar basal body P-ring formation chaperone FlgA [Bradyrhizobium sp.]MBV9565333.1 flagellar basal body P-ring formation protein FlgA [Bradyrhizobium sp.]